MMCVTDIIAVSDGQRGTQFMSQVLWRFGGRRLVIVGPVQLIVRGLVVSAAAVLVAAVRTLIVIVELFIVLTDTNTFNPQYPGSAWSHDQHIQCFYQQLFTINLNTVTH